MTAQPPGPTACSVGGRDMAAQPAAAVLLVGAFANLGPFAPPQPSHGSDRATPAARVGRRGTADAANGLCQRIFSWELSTRHDGGPSTGALHWSLTRKVLR